MNKSRIESILLAIGKPVSFKELSKFLKLKEEEISNIIKELQDKYNTEESGIHLAENNNKVQFITNPENSKILRDYLQEEVNSELTKPSLETLTIIAYRQPISKEELEQIRGINCSMILRNLLIKGLIDAKEEQGGLITNYSITMDFLRYLGIDSVKELPDYDKLNSDENLKRILEDKNEE